MQPRILTKNGRNLVYLPVKGWSPFFLHFHMTVFPSVNHSNDTYILGGVCVESGLWMKAVIVLVVVL